MIEIAPAIHTEQEEVHALLSVCGLSTHGIFSPQGLYWTARRGTALGFCGLELAEGAALLRSVSVLDDYRGLGLARRLVETAITQAKVHSIDRIYLFSKDVGDFFERLGWREVPVAEVAQAMQVAPQVRRYQHVGWYPNEHAFRRDLHTDMHAI